MKQYHDLLTTILDAGNDRGDRTGTGTRSCFGLQFRHDLSKGFPLLTTKRLPFKAIAVELLWFLRGDTNIKYLLEHGIHIWTADAFRMYMRNREGWKGMPDSIEQFEQCILENLNGFGDKWGDLGPVYGKQWRHWRAAYDDGRIFHTDQIKGVIEQIRNNPEGRRHIVTAWNPAEVDSMALPPCHCLYQFYVHNGRLSCHLYQRSADVFLGVPFNIASYALLTHIVAHQCHLEVGELIISFGDVHIYNNHRDQVSEQLSRHPYDLPELWIADRGQDIDDYLLTDFNLDEYHPYPAIKAALSVGV